MSEALPDHRLLQTELNASSMASSVEGLADNWVVHDSPPAHCRRERDVRTLSVNGCLGLQPMMAKPCALLHGIASQLKVLGLCKKTCQGSQGT